MRPRNLAGLVCLFVPTVALAQTGPYLAVVVDPEVKLRAGPSDQFPETATLTKGAPVLVDHEEPNGWLAVQDPPGKFYSLSWVQHSLVDFDNSKPIPQQVVVEEATKLAAGQIGLAQPLTHVRRTTVPAGTILTVVGPKVQFEGKYWHPVAPPAGDFRYIPKSAVRAVKSNPTSFTVHDVTPTVSTPGNDPSTRGHAGEAPTERPRVTQADAASVESRPAVNHQLWAQAEAAERDGRYDDAERYYFQLARLMNEPGGDHDIANLCYTRIHSLREKRRVAGMSSAGGPRDGPSTLLPPAYPGTGPRPKSGDSAKPNPGENVRAGPGENPDERPRWHGPGRLRPSALAIDGRRTYVLESSAGVPVLYVVPAPGVDLDRAVGRRVDVYGPSYTRTGLSRPYAVATAVELAP